MNDVENATLIGNIISYIVPVDQTILIVPLCLNIFETDYV